MVSLHNRISHKELREKLLQENFKRITISFYRYFNIDDPKSYRDQLYKDLFQLQVFGRIYVATEGINAQISVPEFQFAGLKKYLDSKDEFNNLRLNVAVDDDGKSFFVLAIKVRDKIVADGITDKNFNISKKGKYLNADEFNQLSQQKDTIIVDMRNHYEYEVGHLENAIEIPSDTFREQLPLATDMLNNFKENPIIMYCTGGIRCEKASAYFIHKGFKNVYHLEGGIIHYVKTAKEQNLPVKFIGKNFVFDERLGERISEDIIAQCHQCGKPADTHTNCKNDACHLLFIQCDECASKMKGCCSNECKEQIELPLDIQKQNRKGIDKGQMIFNKALKNKLTIK